MLAETDSTVTLGFSIPDIVGLGLGFMAAVLSLIAVAAAIILYFLSVRHSRHLSEIEKSRKELIEINENTKSDIEKNSSLLKEVHLGFSVIQSLINIQSQEKLIEEIRHNSIIEQLRQKEIKSIKSKMKARELELHILASSGFRNEASMQGLAQTYGDNQTIKFLNDYALIMQGRGFDVNNIYEALGSMRSRIQIHKEYKENN